MNLYSCIIGLPIILMSDIGDIKLGTTKDILYSCTKGKVFGLVVQYNSIFSKFKFLPISNIDRILETAIVVNSKDSIVTINNRQCLKKFLENVTQYKIMDEVYSTNGSKVGIVSDISFNFEVGTIDSFIISNGIIEDLVSGKQIMSTSQVQYLNNKIIVK